MSRTQIALLWAALALLLHSPTARAYPTMIGHGYSGCAECHIDPSGGGVLTEYGRGQAENLLRTHYQERDEAWQPGEIAGFLMGLVDLPDWLHLQTDSRSLIIPEPGNFRFIQMQSDMRGAVRTDKLVASASLGWVSEGAMPAWITHNPGGLNLVSREFWVGTTPTKNVLVRAGRMNLPFGLRSENHLFYPRATTRTDTNADQQVGVAASWTGKKLRGEVMGIAGNYQVSPDAFRERGAAGFVALKLARRAELGVSALATHAALDVDTLAPRTRTTAGVFGRVAPSSAVVIMAEGDVLADSDGLTGLSSYVQVDAELTQGVHLVSTGEWCDPDLATAGATSSAGWLGAQWFFAPHLDMRVDAIRGSLYCTASPSPSTMGLAQIHLML